MIEVLAKVNELAELLVAKNATADARAVGQDARQAEQDKTAEQQTTTKEDLVSREAEVAKIESVVELKEKAERLMSEIGAKQDKFVEEKTAHRLLVSKELKGIEEQKADNASIKEAMIKERTDLEAKIRAEIKKKL